MIIGCLRKSLSLAWSVTVSPPTDSEHVVYSSSVVGGWAPFKHSYLASRTSLWSIRAVPRSLLVWWWQSFVDQRSWCMLETAALRQKLCPVGSFKGVPQEWLFPARCQADHTCCCSWCHPHFRAVPVVLKVHCWVWIKWVSGATLHLRDKLWGWFAAWCLIS